MREEDFIDCTCPYCSSALSFVDHQAGTIQPCPACSEAVVVPAKGVVAAGAISLPLRTARLLLRALRATDESDLLELMADEESFRYIDWSPLDQPHVKSWVRKEQTPSIGRPGGHLCLALELREARKVVGFLDFCLNPDSVRQGAFTVMIAVPFRSRGYGTEAVKAALGLAFQSLNLRRVAVCVDSRNSPARHLLENAGMRREGEFLKDWSLKGEWVNSTWYALLAEEFNAQDSVKQ
jgi:RimJ/RimL family protein N-acetyltransferase